MGTHIVSLVHVEIGIHVPLVCAPDCAGHAGPRLLESKHTLDIVTVNFFTGHGVDNGRLNAEERQRRRSRLCGSDTTQRCNDMRASLCLPVCLFSLVMRSIFYRLRALSRLQHVPPPFQQLRNTTSTPRRQWALPRIPRHVGSSSDA